MFPVVGSVMAAEPAWLMAVNRTPAIHLNRVGADQGGSSRGGTHRGGIRDRRGRTAAAGQPMLLRRAQQLKVDPSEVRADCWLVRPVTSFCSLLHGKRCQSTALVRTCWKEL